jgi:hypothetical protein
MLSSDLESAMKQAVELASAKRFTSVVPGLFNKSSSELSALLSSEPAASLFRSAKSIAETLPRDKPIVLLGRDMGPVLPLLRADGFDARYFLWSSVQEPGRETSVQWRREIAPGATVVDTGYSGSIFKEIKRHADPTIQGYLLSRSFSSEFEQLLKDDDHNRIATNIEGVPKLIGRSTKYLDNGNVIARAKDSEGSDASTSKSYAGGMERWQALRELREAYRNVGLPEWDSWRWSQFVGLTSAERLGLNNSHEVQAHWGEMGKLWGSARSQRNGYFFEAAE